MRKTVFQEARKDAISPGSPATVNKSLVHLERIGVVGELTNRQRGRVFSYRSYVKELAVE